MTAKQLSAPNPGDVVTQQTSPCNHSSIIPGLDQIQCRTCHRYWPSWHPDYERLLNQPSTVAPEQKSVLEQEKSVLEQEKSVLEQEKSVLEQEKSVRL